VAYGFGKLNIEPGAVVGFAYDADANLAWLHVNGHWQEAGAVNALPEAGTGGLLLEDADDFVIAVATTTGTVTLEIPELIPTAHVPSGFDTLR